MKPGKKEIFSKQEGKKNFNSVNLGSYFFFLGTCELTDVWSSYEPSNVAKKNNDTKPKNTKQTKDPKIGNE